jgi:hypothetical protein
MVIWHPGNLGEKMVGSLEMVVGYDAILLVVTGTMVYGRYFTNK